MPATHTYHLLLSSATRRAKVVEPAVPYFTSPVPMSSPAELLNPGAQPQSVASEIKRFIQEQFTRMREEKDQAS